MPRDWLIFFDDRIACGEKLHEYHARTDRIEFDRSGMAFDAMVRNVEVLGEAAVRLPESVRDQIPAVPWVAIIGMRHRLAHAYFGIDPDILWDVMDIEVPSLHKELLAYRARVSSGDEE